MALFENGITVALMVDISISYEFGFWICKIMKIFCLTPNIENSNPCFFKFRFL
jgi:hypothetical protein